MNDVKPPLKVGLIGLGSMGRNHFRVLSMLKGVDLVFVYDTDTTRASELVTQYGSRISTNLEADLAHVDAVVLATPTSTHYEYIKRAARHVMSIFVEKPLTDNLETSKEIVELAKNKGLRIQVGFIERFNPAVMALCKVLTSADRIVNIDFSRTNKVSSRITDVDVVTDLMIHDIDLALYLNGPACDVTAYGVMENGMIAFARATITHENGSFSNITASRITEKRSRKISVTCDNKYIQANLLRKEVLITRQTIEQYYEKVSISSLEETIDVSPEEALLSELMAFVQFSAGEASDRVSTGIDGCNSMQVAQRVQKIIRGQR